MKQWQAGSGRSGGSTGAQKNKKSAQKVVAEKKAKRDPGTYRSKLEKLGSTLLVKLNRQKRLKRKPSRRNKWKHEERKRDKKREKERDGR